MSRLVIKGLPKKITEEKLRSIFGAKGSLTDVQLKYTKEGVFRQFAFVGYESDEQAQAALNHFNNSYIQTSRIKVEVCAPLGATEKPKAWSKYSKESSAYKKDHGIDEKEIEEKKTKPEKKNKKKERLDEILGKHKNDPEFKEFMEVHTKDRNIWANDATMLLENEKEKETQDKDSKTKDVSKADKTKPSQKNGDKSEGDDSENDEDEDAKLAEKEISDLDYMKSLMKNSSDKVKKSEKKEKSKKDIDLYTIKINNLPYNLKRQEIMNFFKPTKPYSVRLPRNFHGVCYVGFKTEKDFQNAMIRHKSFIKGKQIFFSDFTQKNKVSKQNKNETGKTIETPKNGKWSREEEALKNEEDISESGRIYFRNLAYTVKEDDIQEVFEKYGPIAEISLPIDSITRQIKGFGTVTFVMPEHAVKAFTELDGSLFHGRLFHLIPAKSKDNDKKDDDEAKLSFKERKALGLKKSAGDSYNWNTLFLGSNAVADILAKRLETTKENILDSKTGGSSAAVRLALGETEIVMEMKQFLEENDVHLDAFATPTKKRSNTVILAKNLPADTMVADLRPLFSKFGIVGRLILPPSGVTALIEFMDPSEARKAFKNLAYSRFKSLPLYLEWAPENTFKTKLDPDSIKAEESNNNKIDDRKENNIKNEESSQNKIDTKPLVEERLSEEAEASSDNDDADPEPDTTLFLRNLNFRTREDAIQKHFKHLGPIHIVQVAMRKDPEDPKERISLGYGFIQFKKKSTCEKALKTMQFTQIEGNQVELKRSDRVLKSDVKNDRRKSTKSTKQTGTKILVRNIPFQAKANEVRDIFKAFGELKSVRLPLKMVPGAESHRGFCFVDFVTKSDAKKAFDAVSKSTHLYGRRLCLEWAAVDDDSVDELRKRTAESFQGYGKAAKISRKGVFDDNAIEGSLEEEDR